MNIYIFIFGNIYQYKTSSDISAYQGLVRSTYRVEGKTEVNPAV